MLHPGCGVSDSVQIRFLLSLDSQYTSQKVLLVSEACFSQRPWLLPDLSINAPGILECFVPASWHSLWQTMFVICDFSKTHGPQINIGPGANPHAPQWESLLGHQQGDRRGQCSEPASHLGIFLLNLLHSSSAPVCSCDSAHPSIAERPPSITLPHCLSLHHKGPSWRQSVSWLVNLELRPS